MILVMKKTNLVLVGLVILLLLTIYSLNLSADDATVSANPDAGTRQMTVMIDPGHGGEDPGAVSEFSGVKEKDINLKISMMLRDILLKDNYKVIMTREQDRLEYDPGTTSITEKRRQDLTRRKKLMDDGGANIVVSVHLNKFPQSQYFGAQTLYPPKSSDSKKLADDIQKYLRDIVDKTNNRVALEKKEPIIILKDVKTPTVLVECGFFSNPDEEKKLISPDYQQLLAQAIKTGIDSYFK